MVLGAMVVASVTGCTDDGVVTPATTARPVASTSTTTSASTSTAPTTTSAPTTAPATTTPTPSALLARDWVGSRWRPAIGSVTVEGRAIGLTSVTGLCLSSDCAVAIDLLTDAPTGAAPAPGPYLVWASRLVGRDPDGTPNWQVTAQQLITIPDGASPTVCTPSGDATTSVLGLVTAVRDQARVTPRGVWTVDAGGSLVRPDPGAYVCELGQD